MPLRPVIVMLSGLALAACSSGDDTTASSSACAQKLYSPYNPRDLRQCVGACKACDNGNTNTCTTSCTLRGAR